MVREYRDLLSLVTAPQRFLAATLPHTADARTLLLGLVAPLAAIRAFAVLVRSVFGGSFTAGLLLALGSFLLLIGTWLAVSIVLPTVARQLKVDIDNRTAFGLITYASVPLWAAGVFYIVPEDPAFLFVWSRLAVLLIASYGIYVLYQGICTLPVEPRLRPPLLGLVGLTYVAVYAILFTLLGILMWIVLFAFKLGS